MADAWSHYRELLQQGKEGTVFKKATAIWRDGTSLEQGKLKLKAPFELRVKGFNEGTGKYIGQLGSLICQSECGQLEVNISGRGDKMRAEVWANKDSWLESIITAEGNLVMEPSKEGDKHSIFLPIFLERRTDKTTADSLLRIREQFNAAIAAV
jgi:DNA ligase-1